MEIPGKFLVLARKFIRRDEFSWELGQLFPTLEEAKEWIEEQTRKAPGLTKFDFNIKKLIALNKKERAKTLGKGASRTRASS